MPKNSARVVLDNMAFNKPVSQHRVERIMSSIKMPPANFVFITQTLKPSLYKHSMRKQFDMTYMDFVLMVEYVAEEFCIVAELTKDGNIHYHGWLLYKESKVGRKMLNEMIKANDKFGYIYFSKVNFNKTSSEQMKDAYAYLCKDVEETYRFLRTMFVFTKRCENTDVEELEYLNTLPLDE